MKSVNTAGLRSRFFPQTSALVSAFTAIPALVIQFSSAAPLRPLGIAWEAGLPAEVEVLFDAVRSPDGYYLTGSTPFPRHDQPLGGWVARVSDAGQVLWRRNLPESANPIGASIITASDGSILIGTEGLQITRWTPQGDLQWKLLFGSGYYTLMLSSLDGGCVAATSTRLGDIRVISLTAAGRLTWERTFGGFGPEAGGFMAAAPDDGMLLGMTTSSPMSDKVPGPGHGFADAWLLRLDPLGRTLWQKRYGGSGNDSISALVSTPDGGCWLAIASDSPQDGNKPGPNHGSEDWWILHIGPAGETLASVVLGGRGQDRPYSILPSADGGAIIAGFSSSHPSGTKHSPRIGHIEVWVAKVDAAGRSLWQQSYGVERVSGVPAIVLPGPKGNPVVATQRDQ